MINLVKVTKFTLAALQLYHFITIMKMLGTVRIRFRLDRLNIGRYGDG